MTHFAYVDESGTKDDQEVMTVALVVMEGAATAAAVQKHMLAVLHPKHKNKNQNRSGAKPKLHFTDMKMPQVRACGKVLAAYPINCFSSHYYHDGKAKSHEERHSIYVSLVEECLKQALAFYNDIEITIAQQGDWQTYSAEMTKKLKKLAAELGKRHGFKRVKIKYSSAVKPGIQIADYYAGAVRGNLLRHKNEDLSAAFNQIERQVRETSQITLEVAAKRKG